MLPRTHKREAQQTSTELLVPYDSMVIHDTFDGERSPIISDQPGTAYCSVGSLTYGYWYCPSIRFHIDGRVQAPTKVRTRGPQAERDSGRGPHGRSSAPERLSLLSKWQEEQLFVGSLRPGTFSLTAGLLPPIVHPRH